MKFWPWSCSVKIIQIDEAALREINCHSVAATGMKTILIKDSSLPLGTLNCSARYTTTRTCVTQNLQISSQLSTILMRRKSHLELAVQNLWNFDEWKPKLPKQKLDLGTWYHSPRVPQDGEISHYRRSYEKYWWRVWSTLTVVWRLAELK